MSFSNQYTQFPQPEFPFPTMHSFPCSFCHESNCIHPHQMGLFQPQDPNPTIPSPSLLFEPTCNLPSSSSAKKDRHTKISTAQGVRDRRVRLSMEIAREFFDLQDMLGFDKASMTIGWLLAKSRYAIQELASAKQSANHSGSSSCASQEDAIAKTASGSKEEINEKVPSVENQANALAARAIREKARARARERTKEKLMHTVPKPTEFESHSFQLHHGDTGYSTSQSKDHVSRSLHLLGRGCEADNLAPPPHSDAPDVTRSNHFLPMNRYADGRLGAPRGHQGLVRVSNVETASSFPGWNILTTPNEMHMAVNPWETWDNH